MATLEDRILGEKTHYYCSSSEDENDQSDCEKNDKHIQSKLNVQSSEPLKSWTGTATNTGPKGVVNDWQCFKKIEAETRAEQEKERIALMKKLTLTCMTSKEEDEYKKQKEIDDELKELLNDEILLNYQKQRMQEMLARVGQLPRFGKVLHLKSSDEFLDAVDKENEDVTVIVHIYEDNVPACRVMNCCLISISRDYPTVKFCKLVGSSVGVSKQFKINGVPALLIYKGGQVIGNFVKLIDIFGDEFFATDVEGYLIEHGLLPDKSFIPTIISSTKNDSDSDVSLD